MTLDSSVVITNKHESIEFTAKVNVDGNEASETPKAKAKARSDDGDEVTVDDVWLRLQFELSSKISSKYNEWEDKYSIYDCESDQLVKKSRDIGRIILNNHHDNSDCKEENNKRENNHSNNEEKRNKINIGEYHLKLKLKKINWNDEMQYVNDDLMHHSANSTRINDCERYLEFVIENCQRRLQILNKLDKKSKKLKKKKQKKRRKSRSTVPKISDHDASNDADIDSSTANAQNANTGTVTGAIVVDATATTTIEESLNGLLEALKSEGFASNDKIAKNVKKSCQATRTGDWEIVCEHLKIALDLMRPFNVTKLLDRYNEYKNACKDLEGKNIVLFLGSTGSGKSTTIHYLKGSKMEQDSQHSEHMSPVNVTDPQLKKIVTCYSVSQSVTSYITPVKFTIAINNDDDNNDDDNNDDDTSENDKKTPSEDNDSNSNDRREIMLCDTPGFADSRGSEIDVANSLTLLNAIHVANSVSIILVLSKDDTKSRMDRFKQIGSNLHKLLFHYYPKCDEPYDIGSDDNESNDESNESSNDDDDSFDDGENKNANDQMARKLEKMQIIFTKFESRKEIGDLFKQYCKENNSDVNQVQNGHYLAKYIHEELADSDSDSDDDEDDEYEDDLILIDPLDDDARDSVLEQLFSSENMHWIDDTEENFKHFITEETRDKIKQQALLYQQHISNIIENYTDDQHAIEKMNFYFIKSKLDKLDGLWNIIRRGETLRDCLEGSIKITATCMGSYLPHIHEWSCSTEWELSIITNNRKTRCRKTKCGPFY